MSGRLPGRAICDVSQQLVHVVQSKRADLAAHDTGAAGRDRQQDVPISSYEARIGKA
ncbi:hypothetical protein [Reyranella sp.]|uniref:hypothetical protein n=1 Tax=Reyranella sp. TaxID=1929291 RepID=UPI003D0976BC